MTISIQSNTRTTERLVLLAAFALSCPQWIQAADPVGPSALRDVAYAKVDGAVLALDLHLPEGKPHAPLIVWVHGGAWHSGSKKEMPLGKLVADGYAVASVDYRLSTQARFPAQVHDLKG